MKRIVVNIDRLVLRGFDAGQGDGFAQGLSAELGRLLAAADVSSHLAARDGVSRIRIGAVRIGQGGEPLAAGLRTAQGIARGLG